MKNRQIRKTNRRGGFSHLLYRLLVYLYTDYIGGPTPGGLFITRETRRADNPAAEVELHKESHITLRANLVRITSLTPDNKGCYGLWEKK